MKSIQCVNRVSECFQRDKVKVILTLVAIEADAVVVDALETVGSAEETADPLITALSTDALGIVAVGSAVEKAA
jgi:hypothetical protein